MARFDTNLHNLLISVDGEAGSPLTDYSKKVDNPTFETVEVIFRHQEQRLLEKIKRFEKGAIFGCVAWLTSVPVLEALAKCDNVQIVVQKEDFLRPDLGVKNPDKWKDQLNVLYRNINCGLYRHEFRPPVEHLSVCADPTVDGIRCVGNHNIERKTAFPRAHHKFLVFCMINGDTYQPVAVWTGSFNLTKNATQSFENVIYFEDSSGENEIIDAYLMEHHQILAISESLNWDSVWSAPEHRIGT